MNSLTLNTKENNITSLSSLRKTKLKRPSRLLLAMATLATGAMGFNTANADIVQNDDVIITFSACIGNDCANGESFGFDTLRIKENNVRIHFDDTSSSASFPSNDWRILINDTGNGGANYFAVQDVSGNKIPFRIAAGARNNALTVSSTGRVGIGTLTPAVDAHLVNGNTPTVRLEQDGSSGFTPQTYDIAGNETNFFVRDVTNGSRLVLRIRNGAPDNALYVDNIGRVAFGHASPGGSLHIRETTTTPANILMEQTNAGVKWEIKAHQNTGRLTFKDLNGSTTPLKFDPAANENLFRLGIVDASTVDVNGNFVVNGNVTISGNCTEVDGACADFVFEPDYDLRSLDDLENFIVKNKHLPDIPSADDMQSNGLNLATMSGRLLQKIEELTLYTLQQQKEMASLSEETVMLQQKLQAFESELLTR